MLCRKNANRLFILLLSHRVVRCLGMRTRQIHALFFLPHGRPRGSGLQNHYARKLFLLCLSATPFFLHAWQAECVQVVSFNNGEALHHKHQNCAQGSDVLRPPFQPPHSNEPIGLVEQLSIKITTYKAVLRYPVF